MLRVVGRRHFTNIAINSLEGRYATALFTAASKKGNLQEVEREVSQLKAWLTESRASILSSPAYDSSQKLSLVQLATKNLSDGLFTRFLQVVHENKRFELLPAIMSVFSKLSEISRGAVAVTVTSHEEISTEVRERIREAIKEKFISLQQQAKFEFIVNSELLGGFIVEVGDEHTIDMSLRSKVDSLLAELRE